MGGGGLHIRPASLTPHHADGHRSSIPVLLLSGEHLLEAARGPDRWYSGPHDILFADMSF